MEGTSRKTVLTYLRMRVLYRAGAVACLSLFLLALLAYYPILGNALIGDDYNLAQTAGEIPLSHIWRLVRVLSPEFMRPLPILSWWLEYNIFGFEGLPGHLANVLLHAGSGFLLYLFLARMGAARLTAWLAAAIFVLNPVAPESVTWAAGRFDVMSLFFLLLTLCLYLLAMREESTAMFAGALLAAAAALLSKESAVVLVVLLPALELLEGNAGSGRRLFFSGNRLAQIGMRLGAFFLILVVYLLLRLAVVGGIGGYSGAPLFGIPSADSVIDTAGTLLAPLNSFMFPSSTIHAVEAYTAGLLLLSLALVARRWRQVLGKVRRLWLFLAVFLLVSLGPVYSYVFIVNNGVRRDMNCSRFLYVTAMALTTLVVVGLLEFGWQRRGWRMFAAGAVALLLPVYFWGLNHNNRPWQEAAAISENIPRQTRLLLPDPPAGATLYFQAVPFWQSGAYVYVNGLERAVRWQYGREDLVILKLAPGQDPPEAAGGYLFAYDPGTEGVRLVRGPRT